MQIEIATKSQEVNTRCAVEVGLHCLNTHETVPTKRYELAHGHAVSRHHVRRPFIKATHDLATLIAQLALGDLPVHSPTCSTACYTWPHS